jgi:hypothetical protein
MNCNANVYGVPWKFTWYVHVLSALVSLRLHILVWLQASDPLSAQTPLDLVELFSGAGSVFSGDPSTSSRGYILAWLVVWGVGCTLSLVVRARLEGTDAGSSGPRHQRPERGTRIPPRSAVHPGPHLRGRVRTPTPQGCDPVRWSSMLIVGAPLGLGCVIRERSDFTPSAI